MKTNPALSFKLKSYSLLIGSFFLGAKASDAQIIYTDVNPDDTLMNDQLLIVDFNGDGLAEYTVHDDTWTNSSDNAYSAFIDGDLNQALVAAHTYFYEGVLPQQLNDIIGPSNTFITIGQSSSFIKRLILSGQWGSYGPTIEFGHGYAAARFVLPDGSTHYGWIEMTAGHDGAYLVVHGYAYNTIADAPIAAGDTGSGSENCEIPTSLTALNITASSVKLKWEVAAPELSYKIRYKIAGSGAWTVIKSVNDHKTIHGLAADTKYVCQVKSVCDVEPFVASEWSEKQFFTTDILRLSEQPVEEMVLDQEGIPGAVYPNPFSSAATVSFFLKEASDVELEIIAISGSAVKIIATKNFPAGNNAISLDRGSLRAGVYLLQLKTSEGVMTKKIVME
ncbi:MAG TPA: T9SS type A sorting domain-containing protein [Chitinophagales bacterium]|nr:T9SS type A sorting domain-containing protein [Chitinophagales bacterium]